MNTFCKIYIAEYNQITHHEKQTTGYMTTAINNNEFVISYYIKLLQNKEIIKKGVPQKAKISKLERVFAKSPSQPGFVGEHL